MCEEHTSADHGAATYHGLSSKNRSIRVDGDVVFHGGVPFLDTFHLAVRVARKGDRAKRNALVDTHVCADHAGFTDLECAIRVMYQEKLSTLAAPQTHSDTHTP